MRSTRAGVGEEGVSTASVGDAGSRFEAIQPLGSLGIGLQVILFFDQDGRSRLEIELEVDLPALRRAGDSHLQARGRKPERLRGLADHVHARLLWRAPAFALVAGLAGGDDVFPALASALDDGDHVIEGELRSRELRAAVLAYM